MSTLSNDSRRVIEAAHGTDDPSAASRDRVRAAIAAAMVQPPPASTPDASGSGAAVGAGASGVAAKIKLGVAVGVVAVALTLPLVLWKRDNASDRERTPPARAPSSGLVPPAVVDAASIDEPAPVLPDNASSPSEASAEAPRSARRNPRNSRPADKKQAAADRAADPRQTSPLAEELGLLRSAQLARRRGDARAARRLLHAHLDRFPGGVLAAERDAARVRVLCDLGDTESARRLTSVFVRRYPSSPLLRSVRSSCARRSPGERGAKKTTGPVDSITSRPPAGHQEAGTNEQRPGRTR